VDEMTVDVKEGGEAVVVNYVGGPDFVVESLWLRTGSGGKERRRGTMDGAGR